MPSASCSVLTGKGHAPGTGTSGECLLSNALLAKRGRRRRFHRHPLGGFMKTSPRLHSPGMPLGGGGRKLVFNYRAFSRLGYGFWRLWSWLTFPFAAYTAAELSLGWTGVGRLSLRGSCLPSG